MTLKAKTRFYKMSGGKFLLYIPKELTNDSAFPFKDPTKTVIVEVKLIPAPQQPHTTSHIIVYQAPLEK